MEKERILAEVQDIFRDVLDNDDLEINFNTVADDVDEWDSLSHIQLVVGIEKHFGLHFTSQQITKWKDVGAMCDDIATSI
ncbi:MAG: acyl carrier protein [Paraprevotella sp.]|nr:acyl carrier protein [Paraprevotella sp.]